MPPSQHPRVRHVLTRLSFWARRGRLSRKLAMLLMLAALVSGLGTIAALTRSGPADLSPTAVLVLLNVDLILLLLLAVLVARRVAAVWAERRRGGAGSRLHVRFVVLFSVVTAAPAILVAVFSILFFNIGLEAWFSTRVRTALDESLAVAEAYLAEHKQAISGDVRAMAADIAASNAGIGTSTLALNRFLAGQAMTRDLTEAVVFNAGGRVLARAGYTLSLHFEQVPFWALDQANAGEVAVLTSDTDDRVRALVKLEGPFDTYLYAGRFVDARVIGHTQRTKTAVSQYQMLEGRRSDLQITFSLIFIVVALLLLFAAVWFGLSLATRLARPIMALIDAAEKVRKGDLGVRVHERPRGDELGSLTRSFNRMTAKLAEQQHDLMEANRELDERRRFTETVLAGVSAGVIGMDERMNIHLPNPSASILLECALPEHLGRPLVAVWPELGEILEIVQARPDKLLQREFQFVREGRVRTFLVRIAAERLQTEVIGYVLTFDDITELQSAQRKAAWADVARRIAHEIKNPLTPIQLSAERLKRKYLKQISTDADTFTACTDTIVRQVDDIRRMVDEFSEFARMPAPVLLNEDLRDLVSRALTLQRTAFLDIAFEAVLPDDAVYQLCDARQVGQALTNLIKNAVEAIHGRPPPLDDQPPPPKGLIRVTVARDQGHVGIFVEDNGKGLPIDNRDRLTEPYVTTRVKGTGLGLAIVKKIMEDHGGGLTLDDGESGGARIGLVFPAEGGGLAVTAGGSVNGESVAIHGS
ncbi:MAG: PAS domain-containing sensor histidine kinase [Alphaproteobacteria bacterium]